MHGFLHHLFAGLLLTLGVGCLSSCGGEAAVVALGEVRRWEPVEMVIRANVSAPNPFLLPFQAKVTGPDGKTVTLPGFHDGGDVWKVRVMPHTPGKWTVRTESEAAKLDGRRFEFTCAHSATGGNQHGRLRVDEKNPHHFVFEDGSRFFMLAYECDWLWALDTGDPRMPKTTAFLDRISSQGFNSVLVNTFAQDTKWRPGNTAADDYGPPPVRPWMGTAEKPDHVRLNPAYWQHFDRMIQALHERGMITHLLCKVYNKRVKWPGRGRPGDELFFRTLIARYSAYPGIVWDFAKEAHNERDQAYKLGRVRYLREADPFRHLVTVHDDDKMYESGVYDSLVDFRTDQQHGTAGRTILNQHQRRAFPVLNAEFSYEHGADGPKDVTYAIGHAPESMVKAAWEISFAGGYTAYYHTHTAWDVLRPEINPPGYRLFGLLREFFETTQYWKLTSGAPSVEGVWTLETAGEEFIVWLPQGFAGKVKLPSDVTGMNAVWFQPLTGKKWLADVGWRDGGQLVPPADVLTGPLILHLAKPQASR